MRTKPATRWNKDKEHASYGVYNWFRLKGIKDQNIMKEVMWAFCKKNNCEWLTANTSEISLIDYAGKRFASFAAFAGVYLRENNYA